MQRHLHFMTAAMVAVAVAVTEGVTAGRVSGAIVAVAMTVAEDVDDEDCTAGAEGAIAISTTGAGTDTGALTKDGVAAMMSAGAVLASTSEWEKSSPEGASESPNSSSSSAA